MENNRVEVKENNIGMILSIICAGLTVILAIFLVWMRAGMTHSSTPPERDVYEILFTATKAYIDDRPEAVNQLNNYNYVVVGLRSHLMENGYIRTKLINPETGNYFADSTKIYAIKKDGTIFYYIDLTLEELIDLIGKTGRVEIFEDNLYTGEIFSAKPTLTALAIDEEGERIQVKITDNINMNKLGVYQVNFEAVSKTGKKKNITHEYRVEDNTKPEIVVNPMNVVLNIGDTYDLMAGVSVTDNVDKDITATYTGELKTDKAGTYTITYSARDKSGNKAVEVKRTITVQANASAPIATITGPYKTATATTILKYAKKDDIVYYKVIVSIPNHTLNIDKMVATNRATIGNTTGKGTTTTPYLIPVIVGDQEGATGIQVQEGAFVGPNGDKNIAVSSNTFTTDNRVPTYTISGPYTTRNGTAILSTTTAGITGYYRIVVTEANEYTKTDTKITTTSTIGTKGAITGTGTSTDPYVVPLTVPTGKDGAVGLNLAAGAFTDSAGNQSKAGSSAPFTVVKELLTPEISYVDNIASATVTIKYNLGSTNQYRIDDGEWKTYTTPFTISAISKIEARMVDNGKTSNTTLTIKTGKIAIMDTGAKCDGKTDDVAALKTAVTNAQNQKKYYVEFPQKKECLINNTITINNVSTKKFLGNGTTLFMNDNYLGGGSEFWIFLRNSNEVWIDNLIFEARQYNKLVNGGTAFKTQVGIDNTNDIRITNNQFIISKNVYRYHQWNNLDLWSGVKNATVENNRFIYDADPLSNYSGGKDVGSNLAIRDILGRGTENIVVRNNYFHKISHDEQIYVMGGANGGYSKNIIIENNEIIQPAGENNSVQCISFYGSTAGAIQNVEFKNNYLESASSQTIFSLGNIDGATIKDNTIIWTKLPEITHGSGFYKTTSSTRTSNITIDNNKITIKGAQITNFASLEAKYTNNTIVINSPIHSTGTVFDAGGYSSVVGNNVTINGNVRSVVSNTPEVRNNKFYVTGTAHSIFFPQGNFVKDVYYTGNEFKIDTANNTQYNALIVMQWATYNGYKVYIENNKFDIKANTGYKIDTVRSLLDTPSELIFRNNQYGAYPKNSLVNQGTISPNCTFE